MPQEQEQKKTQKRSGGGSDDEAGQVTSASKGEKLKEEMDDILDEIDSVLE
ncbi:MAG TPA: ubiquitin-like protein Pup, partial [Actinomycetota bacterium]